MNTTNTSNDNQKTETLNLNQLEKLIVKWGFDKGIFEKSNPLKQHDKTIEEVLELRDEIVRFKTLVDATEGKLLTSKQIKLSSDSVIGIKDGIGDTIVTLALLARMYGTDLNECVAMAYNEIKGRTGKMVDGQFVKD